MRAPAASASRPVRCAARRRRASAQPGAAARSGSGGAGTVVPASAVLRAHAGPAVVMRTASRASASWVTVTVTYPPVTVAERTQSARRSAAASVIAIRSGPTG